MCRSCCRINTFRWHHCLCSVCNCRCCIVYRNCKFCCCTRFFLAIIQIKFKVYICWRKAFFIITGHKRHKACNAEFFSGVDFDFLFKLCFTMKKFKLHLKLLIKNFLCMSFFYFTYCSVFGRMIKSKTCGYRPVSAIDGLRIDMKFIYRYSFQYQCGFTTVCLFYSETPLGTFKNLCLAASTEK